MSFMKDYQLKRFVENYFIKHSDELYRINKVTFWLNKRWLNAYKKLPDNNARLTRVKECIFKKENDANLLLCKNDGILENGDKIMILKNCSGYRLPGRIMHCRVYSKILHL